MIDQLIPLSDRVSASASDWELWPCNTAWVGVESLKLSWWDHGAKKKELSEFLCSPVHLFHDESDPPKSKQSSQRRKLSFILYVWISSDPSALLEETDGGSGAKCSPPKDRTPLFWLVCASPHHQTQYFIKWVLGYEDAEASAHVFRNCEKLPSSNLLHSLSSVFLLFKFLAYP